MTRNHSTTADPGGPGPFGTSGSSILSESEASFSGGASRKERSRAWKPWMLPDLPLRLDAGSARAHRSFEIASRFQQHPRHGCDKPSCTEKSDAGYYPTAPGRGRF